jgi:hypothetical protein
VKIKKQFVVGSGLRVGWIPNYDLGIRFRRGEDERARGHAVTGQPLFKNFRSRYRFALPFRLFHGRILDRQRRAFVSIKILQIYDRFALWRSIV